MRSVLLLCCFGITACRSDSSLKFIDENVGVSDLVMSPENPYNDDVVTCGLLNDDLEAFENVHISQYFVIGGIPFGGDEIQLISSVAKPNDPIECVIEFTSENGEMVVKRVAGIISNRVPEILELGVNPSEMFAYTELTCGYRTDDLDEDVLTESQRWLLDGQSVEVPNITLVSDFATKGADVQCEVTVSDGIAQVTEVSSMFTVQNSVPTTPSIQIVSDADDGIPDATENDLTCEVTQTSLDSDGDALEYTFVWTSPSGVEVGRDVISEVYSILDKSLVTEVGTYTCTVFATDTEPSNTDSVAATIAVEEAIQCTLTETYPLDSQPVGSNKAGGALQNSGTVDHFRQCWYQTSDWQYLNWSIAPSNHFVLEFSLERGVQDQQSAITLYNDQDGGVLKLRFGIDNDLPCNHACHGSVQFADTLAVFSYDDSLGEYVGMGTVYLSTGLNASVDYRIDFVQSTGELVIQENGVNIYSNTFTPVVHFVDKVSLNATAYYWEHADSCWKDLRIENCE